jgi:prevent-host-death family protein
MSHTTLTSREANQDFSRAKRAAQSGPVIVTERGKPALVLLKYEDYQRLLTKPQSILEALAMPGMEDVEFEIPPRSKDLPRETDLS